MEEKWKNSLQKKMESHVEPEPLGLWDDIEIALHIKKSAPIINYRKAILWTTSIAGIAAMLALIFFLGKDDVTLPTAPVNISPQIAEQTIQETDINQNSTIIQPIEENKSLVAANTTSYNKQEVNNNATQTDLVISAKEDISEKIENDKIEERQPVENKDSDNSQTQSEKGSRTENNNLFPKRRTGDESIDNYDYRRTATNKGRLIASVYSTNLPNTSGESSGYGELMAKTTLPGQLSAKANRAQSPAEDIIISNIGEETFTNTEHKQPVKTGL